MKDRCRRAAPAAAVLLTAGIVAGCSGSSPDLPAGSASAATPLTGTLELAAGNCNTGPATGSFFFMIEPGGTLDNGPFASNPDSPCADKTKTLLAPGTSGGLTFGSYQPQPAKPFGVGGNSAATSIIAPVGLFSVKFGVSTNAKDPQTGRSVAAPTATVKGKVLTASLGAWSVSWNGEQFNQGAPKPDGTGDAATGSYDPATGHTVLLWTSKIVGGRFNNFTGVWQLIGTMARK